MAKMCFSFVCTLLVALHMGLNSVKALPYSMDVKMPAACEGKAFCYDEGDHYPHEKIEALLSDMRALSVENPGSETSIGDRQGVNSNDEPDCPSKSTEEPIYYITDTNDRVRVVVQNKEKFLQIYTVTTCLNEGPIQDDTAHFLRSSHILTHFKMECVSTKMDFDFFVLSDEVDPNTNKPKMEIASAKGGIPVCCKCRYNANDK